MIVKSECFTLKPCTSQSTKKNLVACGTQLGQLFIGDVDDEITTSQEKLFYYQSRYYNTTEYLMREKPSP
jgi:hypothetical protein